MPSLALPCPSTRLTLPCQRRQRHGHAAPQAGSGWGGLVNGASSLPIVSLTPQHPQLSMVVDEVRLGLRELEARKNSKQARKEKRARQEALEQRRRDEVQVRMRGKDIAMLR